MLFEITATVGKKSARKISDALLGAGAMSVSSIDAADVMKTRITVLADDSLFEMLKPVLYPHEYTVKSVEERDWINEWTGQFRPVTVDGVCVITSPNIAVTSDLPVIVIDPRDAFGAGTHPTTVICLSLLKEYLVSCNKTISEMMMIDAGTGSGILAIAAEIFGVRRIDAFDNDPKAISQAVINGSLNESCRIRFFESDISGSVTDKRYDLVTANLQTAIIEKHIHELAAMLDDDGAMIISGISERWNNEISGLFRAQYLEIVQSMERESWMGYLVRKN
jgi:ribosomal protein L11 methyltransferase